MQLRLLHDGSLAFAYYSCSDTNLYALHFCCGRSSTPVHFPNPKFPCELVTCEHCEFDDARQLQARRAPGAGVRVT